MKKKVIILGNIPLATKVVKFCEQHPDIELVGVVCQRNVFDFKNHFGKEPCVYEYARDKSIRVLELKNLLDYKENELFLGISARNNQIISEEILDKFEKGILNFHGGPLPEFRGLNAANWCFLLGKEKFGAAIHYMTKGVDEGPIVARGWFSVDLLDTPLSVLKKVERTLWKLFVGNIDSILNNTEVLSEQEEVIAEGEPVNYFNKNALNDQREIKLSDSEEVILRKIRAFDFPGKEPAYVIKGGRKYYFRLKVDEATK